MRWWLQARDAQYANEQLATLSLQDGLRDPNLIVHVFPDPISMDLWLENLRPGRLSIFYKDRSKWLGRSARQFALPVNTHAAGEVTYMVPVLSGLEVIGWADESQLSGATGWILLTNEKNQIAGFGRKLPAGFPPFLESLRAPVSLSWVGFVDLQVPTKLFSAYVINKRGLLPLQGATPVPSESVVSLSEAGPPIPGYKLANGPELGFEQSTCRFASDPVPQGGSIPVGMARTKTPGSIRSSSFRSSRPIPA